MTVNASTLIQQDIGSQRPDAFTGQPYLSVGHKMLASREIAGSLRGRMQRRQFFAVVGLAVSWPRAVRAQSTKMPVIGILLTGNPEPAIFLRGFTDAFREAGYTDGQNVRLEVRSAGGNSGLLPEKAAELVGLKVDVIVASLTPAIQAAKLATTDIPIVMAPAGEPVGTGLVASLARPGGNITGVSAATAELAGKSLELIREAIPSARRIAVLANEADPLAKPFLEQIYRDAQAIGFQIDTNMVRPEMQLDTVLAGISDRKADAVIVQGSLQRKELFDLAIKYRLPSFSSNRQVATTGGLMIYGANSTEVLRSAAGYVDKILRGSKPADLPVTQPTKFELVINLKVAKAIDLVVPASLLARADEVIE